MVLVRDPWHARLPAEHWTRVKALTRRLGHLGRDEYDTLRPVADLIDSLQTHVRPFLETPLRWEPAHGATDDMMTHAIDKISQDVYRRLHEWVGQRMVRDRIIRWQDAYADRGQSAVGFAPCAHLRSPQVVEGHFEREVLVPALHLFRTR